MTSKHNFLELGQKDYSMNFTITLSIVLYCPAQHLVDYNTSGN